MRVHTHYDNLKIARDAPIEVIHAAYAVLLAKYHPDQHPRAAAIINKAHEVLSDPAQRRLHDEWIERVEREEEHSPNPVRHRSVVDDPNRETPPQPSPKNSSMVGAGVVATLIFAVIVIAVLLPPFSSTPKPDPKATPKAETLDHVAAVPKMLTGPSTEVRRAAPEPEIHPVQPAQSSASVDQICAPPSHTPNGSPWPSTSGYVDGYNQTKNGGRCILTIDNRQCASDKFVKLVDRSGANPIPVRFFFVRAYASLTLEQITGGLYDIRYLDFDDCDTEASQLLDLTETETERTRARLTFYPVINGNTRFHSIKPEEFLLQ